MIKLYLKIKNITKDNKITKDITEDNNITKNLTGDITEDNHVN